uniref:Aspartyl protease ASP1 n=1 Tax=Toxoplasma gondii COUG TaxID=1074873 RepID=A0A2G8XYJ2_TOXGO|nr:aspartyl protease ASP1 [Toxoplasma gondii COUG]
MSPSSRFRNLVSVDSSSQDFGKRSSLYASLLDSASVSSLPGICSAAEDRDVEDESWKDPSSSSHCAKTEGGACAFPRLNQVLSSLRDPMGVFSRAKRRRSLGKAVGLSTSVICVVALFGIVCLCLYGLVNFSFTSVETSPLDDPRNSPVMGELGNPQASTPSSARADTPARHDRQNQMFSPWSVQNEQFLGEDSDALPHAGPLFRSGVMVMPLRKMKSLRQIGWDKNTITVPDLQAHLVAALRMQEGLSKKDDGNLSGLSDGDDISIHDYMNSQYYTEIYVGSPGQKVRVVVDTGSSDLWVCSASCGILCMMHKTYNHGKSDTYHADGTPYHVQYASGPVGGFLSADDVALASLKTKNFLLAEAVDLKGLGTAFFFGKFDGILGMGFPSLATKGLKPFMQAAVEQNVVKNWVFAFYLASANGVDGELAIGGVDQERFIGDINFSPVVDSRYWMINTKGLKSDGDLIAPTTKMIIDSGTSLIVGPLDEVKRIATMMGAFSVPLMPEGMFFISCEKAKVLRDLQLEIEGQDYPIKIKDLLISASAAAGTPCLFGMMGLKALEGGRPTPQKNGFEIFPPSQLVASAKGPIGRTWILGDLFMRNVYTVFDYDNKQIGFARLKN